MSYDLVILDYDGTMVDTIAAIRATFCDTAAAFGQPWPNGNAVETVIGKSLEDCVRELFPGVDNDQIPEMVLAYRAGYAANEAALALPYPGALDMTARLHAAGVSVAVASNKGSLQLGMALERFGFAEHVAAWVGAGQKLPSKPDPAVFETGLRPKLAQAGIAMGRMLMVGDTSIDLVFGRNIRAATCWCSYGYGVETDCMRQAPDLVAGSVWEIGELVLAGG